MKKFMALLLTLAMTASFTAVPVMAQDEDVKLKITPNVTSVDTTEETEVTYTVDVEVKILMSKLAVSSLIWSHPKV